MRWLILALLFVLALPFVSADLLRCDSAQYKAILCEASEGVYKAYETHLNEVKASKSNCGKQPVLPQPPGCEGGWVQYTCPYDEPARHLYLQVAEICSERVTTPPEKPTPQVTIPPEKPSEPKEAPKPVAKERKHCCFCLVKKGMEREQLPIGTVLVPEQCQQLCERYGFLNKLDIIKHIARIGLCPTPRPVETPAGLGDEVTKIAKKQFNLGTTACVEIDKNKTSVVGTTTNKTIKNQCDDGDPKTHDVCYVAGVFGVKKDPQGKVEARCLHGWSEKIPCEYGTKYAKGRAYTGQNCPGRGPGVLSICQWSWLPLEKRMCGYYTWGKPCDPKLGPLGSTETAIGSAGCPRG